MASYSNETTGLEVVPNSDGDYSAYYNVPKANTNVKISYGISGGGNNKWQIGEEHFSAKILDEQEPQLLAVAPMDTSTYKAGDTFTIALIFDEIVDRQNSGLSSADTVSTSWGTANYKGGMDTNVLYFEGTVSDAAGGALTLSSITCNSKIKDMCDQGRSAANAKTTGSTNGSVNNSKPTLTIANNGISAGTAKAAITASNCDELKYTWSTSSAQPVTGWLTTANGSTVSTRQTSGMWYLHVIGYRNANGTLVYKTTSFDFGSPSNPTSPMPDLTVSADNTNWATSRTIHITKYPDTATVKYTAPGAAGAKEVNGTGVSVTQNGVYTFTLTNDGETVVKQVTVSRIDTSAPTAVITEPGNGYFVQSENVTFTIRANDIGGSGVGSVTGKWYKDGSSVGLNVALINNGDGTYTAKTSQTAGTSGTWKLTVTVTDNVGNSATASSQAYTVNLKAPAVTVTKGTTDSNGAVNYTYSVNVNGQTIQFIELPDGTITTNTSGSFKLTSPGTYYVTVTDTAGHAVRSEAMIVTGSVDGEPPQLRLSPSTEEWVDAGTGVTVTVSVYDNIEPILAFRQKQGDAGVTTMTLLQDEDAGVGRQAKISSFKVTENGIYTVTAKDDKGNIAEETIEINNIDGTAPTVTAVVDNSDWSNTSHTITITASDTGDIASGVKSVKYAVVNTSTGMTTSLSDLDGSNGTVTINTNGTNYLYCVVEDYAGNKSACHSGAINVDTVSPVIGALEYSYQPKNLWNWLIGKDSLIITVPVTEEGSGADEITYTMTPEGGTADIKTSAIANGRAKIVVAPDFKGTISIVCTDKAGNTSAEATVGTGFQEEGVIIENKASNIVTDAKADYYDEAADIHVTVKDDMVNADTGKAVTAGIASITYQVGENAEKSVPIDTDALQAEITFTIPASEISTGITEIKIRAVDNAGNSAEKNITIKVIEPEKQPAAEIDYRKEKLTGLVPDGKYIINGMELTADSKGGIQIKEGWFGNALSIVKMGNGIGIIDSPAQNLPIPARPQKPTPIGEDVEIAGGTGKMTGLSADASYEVSTDGGKTWTTKTADENGQITGLTPGVYTVRVKAGSSNFASKNSAPAKIDAYQIKVTFVADGETYKEIFVDYGETLGDIPPVPQKKDGGNQLYAGIWCMDTQGTTPAVFTDITADMTVYAVYTKAYTVTLQGGAGYTLWAEAGSLSPVKEGGSFTFCFKVQEGYRPTEGSFAVKVNGVMVELAPNGTYTITNIWADQTVTVTGVEKKTEENPSHGGNKGNNPAPTIQPAENPFKTEKEQQSDGEQNALASADDEELHTSAEPVITDNKENMTDTGTVLRLGDGAVIVSIVCEEQTYTAEVADTMTVANAVLTPEQLERVKNGETIEIRINVKDISGQVPQQDKEVIENGIEEYRKEIPGLMLGMYIDISLFVKIGEGDWNAITSTREPIEIIIGIPEELQETDRTYYIIRAHKGEHALINDIDDKPDTITISTDMFSSYAIAYVQPQGNTDKADKTDKCSLCHICPTFLGTCLFLWLGIIILIILAIQIIIWKKQTAQNHRKS